MSGDYENRTVRAFVEDCISDGKSFSDIITIARNTHWRTKIDKVEIRAAKLFKKLKVKLK